MSFVIDDVLEALKKSGIDPAKTKEVLEHLLAVEEEQKEEKQAEKEEKIATPKQKHQFVVFVMDDGTLTKKDLLGYVLQIPGDKSPAAAKELFIDAVRDYNNGTKKGKMNPVETIGDAMDTVKGKWLKEGNIKVKTKEAILVIAMSNTIEDPKRIVQRDNNKVD